jgi:hypothetical protein
MLLYQVSVHLAEGFPRRRLKCEKLTDKTTDDGRQVMAKAHIAFKKRLLFLIVCNFKFFSSETV